MPITYERQWFLDANRPQIDPAATMIGNQRQMAWYIKSVLSGQIGGAGGILPPGSLWTIVGSSDGVTAGLDGTDRWLLAYDPTKLVRNNAGAHSWITLRGPPITAGARNGVPVYLTLAMNAANDYTLDVYWGFAVPTAGSITVRPTQTDEIGVGWQITNSINGWGGPKVDGWMSSAGDFAFIAINNGSGFPYSMLMLNVLADTRATDLYPVAMFQNFQSSWPGPVDGIDTYSHWTSRTVNGGVVVTGEMCWVRGADFNPTANIPYGFANTGDAADQAWIQLPTYFVQVTTNNAVPPSLRGRFVDIVAAAPGYTAHGSIDPVGGPPQSIINDRIWMPLPQGVAVTF